MIACCSVCCEFFFFARYVFICYTVNLMHILIAKVVKHFIKFCSVPVMFNFFCFYDCARCTSEQALYVIHFSFIRAFITLVSLFTAFKAGYVLIVDLFLITVVFLFIVLFLGLTHPFDTTILGFRIQVTIDCFMSLLTTPRNSTSSNES